MDRNKQLKVKNKTEEVLSRFVGPIEETVLEKKINNLLEKMDIADEEEKYFLQEQNSELITEFIKMHEFDKHLALADSLPPSFGA